MLDSTYGIARTFWARLFYTSDGGNNWVEIPMPDTNVMNRSIAFADIITPTTIYVTMACPSPSKDCPYRHTFLRTYDLGKNWEFHDISGNLTGMQKMYFADSLNGWMVGGVPNGVGDQQIAKIVATTDGGRSWNVQFFDSLKPMIIELLDVSFHDRNNGIAIARGVEAVYTTDGGKSWIPENVNEIDLGKPFYYLDVPSVCYRNVKEPIVYAGCVESSDMYYRKASVSEVKEYYSEPPQSIIIPNPVENKLIIEATREEKVEIFNLLGTKLIESLTNTEIDISDFPSGIYFIVVRHNGRADVIPVVVE